MSTPNPLAVRQNTPSVSRRYKPWTVNSTAPARPAPRAVALTRRYEVQWIDDDGTIGDFIRVAPALPIFEAAFSAFSHGALIATEDGPVPVEDLEPGTRVETATGEMAMLRWIGAITLVPGAPQTGDLPQRLYRVTADAFGMGRPSVDVTFGPAARLMNRDPAVRNALGCEAALAPVASFEDGVNVVALNPVSPVRVYHLAFDGHHVIRAGGIEVESYHPGPDAHYSMSNDDRSIFLSLFPHLESLQGFGRVLWPRFEAAEDGGLEIV